MEPSTGATTIAERLTIEPPLRYEDLDEELIPGIPNHTTLQEISTKLSFRDLHKLDSVSRDWEKAIQGHLVHDARVRTHSAETFAVFALVKHDTLVSISLCSMRDKSWFQLPPTPFGRKFPSPCRSRYRILVSLDGKLYLLGGGWWENGNSTVYMLDLAGQRRSWKRCASMRGLRHCFAASVLNGKIYVFGGGSKGKHIREAEVYDPKVDSWSTIKSMISFRAHHKVVPVGEELFVHGGNLFTPRNGSNNTGELVRNSMYSTESGFSLEVYHPVKDEWRLIEPFGKNAFGEVKFMAHGKFHAITPYFIHIYAMETRSWSLSQACSFPEIERVGHPATIIPQAALFVDGELLVVLDCAGRDLNGTCVLRSKGFGYENGRIEWEIIVECTPFSKHRDARKWVVTHDLMCSIQL